MIEEQFPSRHCRPASFAQQAPAYTGHTKYAMTRLLPETLKYALFSIYEMDFRERAKWHRHNDAKDVNSRCAEQYIGAIGGKELYLNFPNNIQSCL